MALAVELLAEHHDRAGFASGNEALDRYLQRQARQNAERRISATYVLVSDHEPTRILGFYTLSATAIRLDDLPPELARKLPKYPHVPATLIGRLAVSRERQGQKLGEHLLLDALERSLEHSRGIGSAAVVVDAKDERSKAFYERYGFIPFQEQPLRLFLPMKTIERAFPGRA